MFVLRDEQISQLAVPFVGKLLNDVLDVLKESHPDILQNNSDDTITIELCLLLEDSKLVPLLNDHNIIQYMVMCYTHNTNYNLLMLTEKTQLILLSSNFTETEKVYLLEEKLMAV